MKEVANEPEVAKQGGTEGNGHGDRGKGAGHYNKIYLPFLIGSILFTGIAIWGIAHGIKDDLPVPPSAIASDSGSSYASVLPESDYWLFKNLSDNPENSYHAKTQMF